MTNVLAVHHNKRAFDLLFAAISEESPASASCKNMVIAVNPEAVSTIQIRKLTYIHTFFRKNNLYENKEQIAIS